MPSWPKTHLLTHFTYVLLYLLCLRQPHKLLRTNTHMHTVHMASIISLWYSGLEADGMLESVTAYNITMMEMSLSSSVLWVTCVLVTDWILGSHLLCVVFWLFTLYVRPIKYPWSCISLKKKLSRYTLNITQFCPSLVLHWVKAQWYLWTGHWLLYLIKIQYSQICVSSSLLRSY